MTKRKTEIGENDLVPTTDVAGGIGAMLGGVLVTCTVLGVTSGATAWKVAAVIFGLGLVWDVRVHNRLAQAWNHRVTVDRIASGFCGPASRASWMNTGGHFTSSGHAIALPNGGVLFVGRTGSQAQYPPSDITVIDRSLPEGRIALSFAGRPTRLVIFPESWHASAWTHLDAAATP